MTRNICYLWPPRVLGFNVAMIHDATVIVLTNAQYDAYSTLLLDAELCKMHASHAVIDCRNVRYADTTALGAFVRALKRLRSRDRDSTIVLTNVTPLLRQAFIITHLDELFEFE